ncbi:MAG: glycosyltransferase [Phaeodactylibacter sp.]|uniref:glycosyltransferase n=1 Tax=Phaeodactylibacter sp. TaxID=1940289 RepID=UPI0032F080D6
MAGLIVSCACFALGLAYFLLIHWVLRHWNALPVFEAVTDLPSPSTTVLVAARNEAANISLCLRALSRQSYPAGRLQIVVIDDHSTDATAAIVAQHPFPNLTLLRLPDGRYGKKAALELGAATTQSAIILTTDADCQPPTDWVWHQVQHLQSGQLNASTGPVVLTGTDSALFRFQALDMAGMMVLTAVGLRTNTWTLGNGANLAYYRAAFEEVGGYTGNRATASGDDIFLIAKINTLHPYQVQFLKNANAAVPTPAAPGWRAFFRQRLRWGTKNAAAPASAGTTLALGIAFLLSWSIVLSPLLFFWVGKVALLLFVLLLALKSWADYHLLKTASRFFGQPRLLKSFAVSELLHIAYIALTGIASLLIRQYRWKGRTVR